MKKRIMSILVVLSMVLSLMPFFALPASADTVASIAPSNANAENVGSEDNPYRIASPENLVWFCNSINNGIIPNTSHADLTTNLTLEGVPRINDFRGVFDGRNHTLNLGSFSMLFKYVQGGAIVRNLHIRGTITLPTNETCVGGICGCLIASTISNCSFVGDINAWDYIGLIAGVAEDDAVIENTWSSGTTYGNYSNPDGWSAGGPNCTGIVSGNHGAVTLDHCFTDAQHRRNRYPGLLSNFKFERVKAYDCYATGPDDSTTSEGLGVGYGERSFSYSGQTSFDTSLYSDENGWKYEAGMKHPIFKQYIKESSKKRTLDIYDAQISKFNLTDYFDIILPEDKDYNQDGRFTYTITENQYGTTTFYNEDTGLDEEKSVTLASINETNTDLINLNGEIGIGKYNINVNAEDTKHSFDNFDISLEIRVHHRVPAPQVLVVGLSYSRMQTLGMIPVTNGWEWGDTSICPKNTNTTGYPVFFQYEEGMKDYYDYSAVENAGYEVTYDEERNGIWVTLPVIVAESDESPRSMTITVLDADYPDSSPKPIEGATVVGEYDDEFVSENGHVTDAKGEVYAEISPGFEELNVSAYGYQSKTETVEILGKPNSNAPVLKLTPVRTAYTACDVRERETDNPIPNAQVSIMKISDEPTLAWNGGADSLTVDAKTEFTLPDGFPDGRFKITNATYGWSHDDVAYMKVENGEYRYYTDAACTVLASDQTLASVLHAVKLSEPMYDLRIDKATDGDAKHYTATVKLSNINATYGTFGISWDPELFTFDPKTGFNAGAAVAGGVKTAEKLYNGADADDYNALGYYGFLWSASDKKDTVLEAELEPVEIATFDFYLKDASLADMLTVDTFSIEPWQDIKAARDWAAAGKAANSSFDPKFWEYWRVCDSDNVRSNLKEGRIDATKSVVNGVETNGFFQAAVNGAIGDDNPSSFYDVMTDLQYGFPIKNSVIRFHVTDLYSGDEVEGAKIKLFDDTATKLLASKNTSYTGRANFTVNTADKTDPKFAYEVTKPGYWPLPLSQLDTDRPFVKTTTGKATEVEVQLDKKVYHDTVIVRNEDDEAEQTLELVKSADLGGERYAYNGRDFHFRIKGAKGYRITKYPTKAWVSIGDENAGATKVVYLELKPSSSGLFTLDGDYLKQDSLTEEYMRDTLHYEDVLPQPDKEGYRSYNIEVKFDKFEVMELDYLVEGMTGAHGQVSYSKDTADYTGNLEPFIPDPYTDGDYTTDIKVRTKKSSKDTSTDPATKIPADHKTGTFTFKADDGYMVERVYINGLQTDIYDDLTTFDYSFGDVDMDCSIIVMFWDGETPSTDSVLTLVVGDWGYVDAQSPKEEQDLICTRRTYLNPTANLEFTTNAAKFSTDYELYKVEREIEGESRVDITDKAVEGKYSVAPVEAKNVIAYVTFKNKDADITPTLFVKSYVYSGQGVADPAGILIYNFFDSVEIDLIADSANAWLARGVMLSPYEDLDDVSEYEFEEKLPKNTYRYDSLTESIAIGSVFMEKAYPIDGYIDLGQKANISGAPIRGAVVKFVRLDDNTKQEKKKQIPFMTDSTAVRSNSKFETELPVGWWNVYVMKQGYVTYKITNFYMDRPAQDTDVRHFGHNGTVQQKVVPLIGSTRSGESVTLEDAADVKSGMRKGVSSTVFNMTDVDNTGQIDYIDLAYVWKNYNKYMFEQEYSDFAANGSKDIAAMTTPEAP